MRWFKHLTRTWEDEKITRLVELGGIEAYGFYWRMVEIVAAKIEENSSPDCRHSSKTWARLCNVLANRWLRLAQLSAKCGLFTLDSCEGLFKVEIPTILKYRDEYSKKRGKAETKTPDKLRTISGETPEQEQKQIQKQIQKKKSSLSDKPDDLPPGFDDFWAIYPRRDGKQAAAKTYAARLKGGAKPEEILTAAKNYAAHCEAKKTERHYIKLPKTFLGPDWCEWLKKQAEAEEDFYERMKDPRYWY